MATRIYQETVKKAVKAVLEALVDSPAPISGSQLLGAVRTVASSYGDAPMPTDVMAFIQKGHPSFLAAVPVDPDDEAAPGVAYRDLPYFIVVGNVKYGRAPNRMQVRMDLTA